MQDTKFGLAILLKEAFEHCENPESIIGTCPTRQSWIRRKRDADIPSSHVNVLYTLYQTQIYTCGMALEGGGKPSQKKPPISDRTPGGEKKGHDAADPPFFFSI